MRDYLCRLLLSIIFNWVYDRTWVPAREYFYHDLENNGILTVEQAKGHYNTKSLFRSIREAQEAIKLHEDLPETWQVELYDEPYRHMPYLDLMQYGNEWIRAQAAPHYMMGYLGRKRYEYMYEVVRQRVRMYDLMDDVRRPHVPLYMKRIKLHEVKEMLGVEKYEDIPKILPPVVPPEFIPDPQR